MQNLKYFLLIYAILSFIKSLLKQVFKWSLHLSFFLFLDSTV